MGIKSNAARRSKAHTMTKRAVRAQPPAKQLVARALPPEREGAVRVDAFALPGERVLRSRRNLAPRLAWLDALQRAAERDAARLVTVPLEPEANLSREEIAALGDRIALLARIDGYYRRARSNTRARLADEGGELFARAAELRAKLLRGFDLIFRKEPTGRAHVRAIRKGTGVEDLIADVDELLALCAQYRESLARLTKGEADAARELAELSPGLRTALAASQLPSKNVKALRDRVYTLVVESAARIRSAARYEFADDPTRRRDYRAYSAASN